MLRQCWTEAKVAASRNVTAISSFVGIDFIIGGRRRYYVATSLLPGRIPLECGDHRLLNLRSMFLPEQSILSLDEFHRPRAFQVIIRYAVNS